MIDSHLQHSFLLFFWFLAGQSIGPTKCSLGKVSFFCFLACRLIKQSIRTSGTASFCFLLLAGRSIELAKRSLGKVSFGFLAFWLANRSNDRSAPPAQLCFVFLFFAGQSIEPAKRSLGKVSFGFLWLFGLPIDQMIDLHLQRSFFLVFLFWLANQSNQRNVAGARFPLVFCLFGLPINQTINLHLRCSFLLVFLFLAGQSIKPAKLSLGKASFGFSWLLVCQLIK